jgi:branched-chain amino acid transport system permease protein
VGVNAAARWLGRGVNLPLLVAAAAFVVPVLLGGDPYALRILTVAGVYALLGIGYHFAFGQAGLLSLAQGTFFGLGAYVTGILASRWGIGAAISLPLAILLPVLLAAVVALPVLRLASHYFALATLAIAQAVLLLAVNWTEVTGGANGLAGLPGLEIGGWRIGRGLPLLLATWAVVILGAVLAWRIARGRLRVAWQVAREDEIAARCIGLDVGRLRLAAFLLAAGYAGAAGALQAQSIGVVSPEVLQFGVMVACLTLVVVGGRLSIAGAILGAILLVHLPEWFRFLDRHYLIAYGAVLLVMIVAAPDGIVGRLEAVRARLLPEPPTPLPAPQPLPARRRIDGAILAASGLSKSFGGVTAVDGVALQVASGEILGLIGPNGSGKTTLLNLISGIERPDGGTLTFAGADATPLPAHARARAGLARSFQTPRLAASLSLLDNVAAARLGLGVVDLAVARGQARALLQRLDLDDEARRLPAALSPGTLRRAEIARALALEPALLLLDEPAAGLTPAEQTDLAARLRSIAAAGVALVVVEHNLPFLMGLADRLICLDAGRVIAEGPPEAVRADPHVAAVYLGRAP